MSYNIDAWKTKTINNLYIPLEAVRNLRDTEIILKEENYIEVEGLSEMFELIGQLDGKNVQVLKIYTGGEGSGSTWEDFKQMLTQSKGKLVATQVWEGGDSITKLIVNDGQVKEENIEI